MPNRIDNSKQAAAIKAEIHSLTAAIEPILQGRDPIVQSAVLADLLSLWLAGWPRQYREQFLAGHIELVRDLTPISELQIYGDDGHPQNSLPH